ncbi:Superoxide-generating NADPH oxidase heavy chain subunit A [Cyphellophora attinorum]|uniref:Superoxide-generating NADPH oxidase heavy chain subunit A n=1 Tax=Cyphellophora attinorum TaxID=1664694 RepID=A0A0N1HDS4_9EURO|nr:Superoxide-generating NADPH oxidase heavy chain subunit A [Phialophora attinorum]KPI42704.1 Superoxide-generating NADPH oxidase heavy chain subunit A [Phialophora attinorum]
MLSRSWLEQLKQPRKVLFFVLWWTFHWGIFAFGWYKQASDIRLAGLNTLTFSVWLSRGAGLVLSVDTMLIVLPMCRTLMRWIRPKFKFLPLDETQWFHRQTAYALLVFTCVHVLAHYVNFFNVEKNQIRPELALDIHYAQAGGITGHIMLLCMLLMYTTAHHKIRQQSFETFWYTHHLFIPFLLGMYTHATGCFVRDTATPFSPFAGKDFWDHCIGYEGWRWELWTGGIYLIERLYREIRARRETKIVKVIRHPYDAMEIQFRKPSMKYKAGQWLFLQCPSVSGQQWHPFTITSCPYDPYISVHVRQVGDFTKALGNALGCGPAQAKDFAAYEDNGIYEVALNSGQEMPALRIDGPYGAPAEDVFDNEIAVLVGTGIGVTPWASVLKHIYNIRAGPNPPKRLKRVEFIWVTRSIESFEWFQTLLSSLEAQSEQAAATQGGPEFLRIHTYLTQKVDQNTAANIYLNTVGNNLDPLTELKTKTQFGRPDFKRLFGAMRDGLMDQSYMDMGDVSVTASTKATVGVYFCGPGAAAREIRQATKGSSNDLVKFRFWKEHF